MNIGINITEVDWNNLSVKDYFEIEKKLSANKELIRTQNIKVKKSQENKKIHTILLENNIYKLENKYKDEFDNINLKEDKINFLEKNGSKITSKVTML
jgi:hypothetical protein